jgi:hypothetical protein
MRRHWTNHIPERGRIPFFIKTVFTGLLLLIISSALYAAPEKPVISRQPAGATYSERATARFYVNAYSIDGGYLTYQWYRSQLFGAAQTDPAVIKNGAVALPEGRGATIITATPEVSGTQYCYYWVKITNIKAGESVSVESAVAQTKIADRKMPDHIINGDMEYWRSTPVANPKQFWTWSDYNIYYSAGGKDTKGNTFQYHNWLNEWHGTPTGSYNGNRAYYPNEAGATFASDAHYDAANGWYTTHSVYRSSPASGAVLDYGILEVGRPLFYRDNQYVLQEAGHGVYVIELGADEASNIYQDIATVPGKIYEWSLDHAARPTSGSPQKMAVIIGKNINESADYGRGVTNRWNKNGSANYTSGYPYGVNINSYFNDIVNRLMSERKLNAQNINSGTYTVNYNGSAYYVYIGSDVMDSKWSHYSGVYSIPSGQGTTVFGFVYIYPINEHNGNILDNIVFASGSPPALSTSITYGNDVSLSVSTKAGYVYGIAEVRGSSVSLVPDAAAYYDPDGSGASSETAISKTAGLGIDGWYSTYGSNTPFSAAGVITFKNLTPGKTYRIAGIPALAVNNELHTNESPEYVLDEGYYKDIQTAPAYEGSNTVIWNIDVDTYIDGATERARVSVKNARPDVEYALLAGENGSCTVPATAAPAHIRTRWISGTSGRATFDSLALDACYFLVARPYGYDEVTYADAAYDADGKTPKYIRIKTPGVVADIREDEVSRNDCKTVAAASKTGYTYALVDPETGVIIGSVQNGNGSALVFTPPDVTKTYQVVTKSGDVNWLRGVRAYPCAESFSVDYINELVKSSRADGNIPTEIEYHILCGGSSGVWMVGDHYTWIAGIGTQPVNLADKVAGSAVSILDSITAINMSAMIYYRFRGTANGYDGRYTNPVFATFIPTRPAAPAAPVNYVFNYKDEKITAVSGELHFTQTGTQSWKSISKNADWTFADAGWGEGISERLFSVRIPANGSAFASAVRRDTVPARPAAPDVGLKGNDEITKAVIFGMIDGREYEYYTSLSPAGWISYTPNGTTESDSIDYLPSASCYVRLAATNTAPASVTAVLSSPIAIQPVHFAGYTYGDKPVAATVVISNSVSVPVDIIDLTLDGDNSQYYHFAGKPSDAAGKRVPANGTNTNWTVIPNDNLDAGTHNALLKMTYTYHNKEYTAYADVFLTVEKIRWDMTAVAGVFDTVQTRAQRLVLNISGAPAGARLSYYYGQTPFAGDPESAVGDDGSATYTFTADNGLQPETTYPVATTAREDVNHHASSITPLANGYTAYATPVFGDIVSIDYINERLTFAAGHSSADYTLRCASCPDTAVVASPYSLYSILEDAGNDNILFSIIHNAGVSPPYPASEAGYSGTVRGRPAAPENISVTKASDSATYDGRIDLAGHFEYRVHGTATWSSASGSVTGLGVGAYDVRYPATNTAFASRSVKLTVRAKGMSPLSKTYVACYGISVTLGFEAAAGVTYDWYTVQSGGTSVGSGNTKTVTKDGSVRQTWWVEPKRNGVSHPRIRIDLELGNCGVTDPQGCAGTGKVLFKEDFGGNTAGDPTPKPSGIPQVVGYVYSASLEDRPGSGNFPGGRYSIAKSSATLAHPNWNREIDDHTYPNDKSLGYLMGVDGPAAAGLFYEQRIDGLCDGPELYFSIWISNILKNTAGATDAPQHIIRLEDLYGNVFVEYHTFVPNDGNNAWKLYGFRFTVPENVSSVKLKIFNHSTGSAGNDFAFDDIEIRFCPPPVSLTQPADLTPEICASTPFTFAGSYTDDGSFGDSLVYRWEYSPSGDGGWTSVTSSRGYSSNGTVNSVYTLNPVKVSDAGYYRLSVTDSANRYSCRAVSDAVHLRVLTGVVSGTVVGDRTVCENTVPATLTSTAATGGSAALTYQWQESIDDGAAWTDVSSGTGGTTLNYTPPVLIRTTMYRLKTVGGTNPCETVYSNAVKVTVVPTPSYPDIRIRACPDVGEVNLAKYIDTLDGIKDIQWSHRIAGIPVSSPDGTVSTEVLAAFRIHTLTYTVTSRCANGQKRKVYLEILQDDFVRQLRDTVAVCYLTASALLINQLLGIEAGGTWSYPKEVAQYVTESASPVHDGAVVMNGKGVYEDASIPSVSYRGTPAKTVRFTYATDSKSCLNGKTFQMVIVLTKE